MTDSHLLKQSKFASFFFMNVVSDGVNETMCLCESCVMWVLGKNRTRTGKAEPPFSKEQ